MIYILLATLFFVAVLFAVYHYDNYKLRQLLRDETETALRKEEMRTNGHTPLLPEKPRLHFANLPPAKPRAEAPRYNRGYPIAPKTAQSNKKPEVKRTQEAVYPEPEPFAPAITAMISPDPQPAPHSQHQSTPSHYTGPAEACNAESFASDSGSSYSCDSGSSYSDSSPGDSGSSSSSSGG